MPSIIGFISIALIGITSVTIVELFDVKNKMNIVLISGILVTFPTIACTFSYMYTIDGYMIALLLSTLSVLFAYKYKYGFLIGAILICFSLGTYQAYISVTIILCILKLIFLILNKETSKKEIIVNLVKNIIMGLIGFILYYIILQIMLKVQHVTLSSYQGANALSTFSISNIIEGIKMCIKDFIDFPKNMEFFTNNIAVKVSNIIITLLIVYLCLKEYISQKVYKKWFNTIILILLVAVIPIGLNTVYLISTDTTYHMIMRYAWCLFYIASIILLEKVDTKNKIHEWVGTISIVIIIFNFIIVSNIGYFNLYYKFEKSYATALKLSERIEEFPNYNENTKVAIIGNMNNKLYPSTNKTKNITRNMTGIAGDTILHSQKHYYNFFAYYFNITINTVSSEQIEEIREKDEFKKMQSYPNKQCVQMIDNILVVKLSD